MPKKKRSSKKQTLEGKYKVVLDTIRAYPAQLIQAWKDVSLIYIPDEYKEVNKVVVCGMGGSNLGARMVDSLMINRIRIPIEIFPQYNVPNYTDAKTLVISYSFSGNTEETLSCYHQAQTREAKIFAVTSDGKLAEQAVSHSTAHYKIDPIHNPSGQPRFAIGYALGSILSLFSKLEIAHIDEREFMDAAEKMYTVVGEYDEAVDISQNLAKSFAKKLTNKAAILVASEHLTGTAHTIKNQLNESAKTFSALFELPELNHHLMEGLTYPKELKKSFHFIFFHSNLYSDRVQMRYPLTEEVVEKNGYAYSTFIPNTDKKIQQVFETLIFGSFTTYYLSKNYKIDPTTIPWVDYFKNKLSKK
jgi:glucose/mannose-6-phosphate isomerase